MFKFIHTADLHLDSPLRGLQQYEGAPVEEIRGATRRALENLVALASAEEVSLVLIAGDVYDGDWRDYNTGLFFSAQMSRLREAGIHVVIASGNHDAASQITRPLRLPDNVKVLSTSKPETYRLEDLGVAIHGQGFAQRQVTSDVCANYPPALPGYFNIGLLHTSATGREGHEPYAPCSLADLQGKGYDYWALGHVHAREVLGEDPWIIFPGNTQGRHARETGNKGCTLVTVDEGRVVDVAHRDLAVVRWAVCEVDIGDCRHSDELLERIIAALNEELGQGEHELLAARLRLIGTGPMHAQLAADGERWTNEIRSAVTDAGGGAVWLEKIEFRTEPEFSDVPAESAGGLIATLEQMTPDDEALQELAQELEPLTGKLPGELRSSEEPLDTGPEGVAQMLPRARALLIARLQGREGEER